ncbi:MAG: ribonuclease H-like domain-containing protein [Desulfobacteraceae bacterium]|jgi:hypothetical protein
MLEHTFVHIQSIGPKTERSLWRRGIDTWDAFLHHPGTVLSRSRDALVRDELERSLVHRSDIRFFQQRLRSAEMWRLFEAFRDRAVYLDIETSGGYEGLDEITVIGLYDGKRVQTFVNGVNLDAFEIAVAEYDLVITFNGGPFDLPYIRRHFPGISLPPAHIDLRFFLRQLGFSGGLKAIERQVGLVREDDVNGLDGRDAVFLWAAHCNGDPSALDRLVRYNTADIVHLEPLMSMGYARMKARLLEKTA